MRCNTNTILGHTFRKHKRSPTLASGFRTIHPHATKSPECYLVLLPVYTKTAKSHFIVQCVNTCLALINMNALKALQIHVKLKTLHTKNKRKNLAAKVSFATLHFCCYAPSDVSSRTNGNAPPALRAARLRLLGST